jgi:diguanylate cyclase (GGDEF)-like protein
VSVSRRITFNLLFAIVATIVTMAGVLVWLANEADSKAAIAVEQMVQRGLDASRADLERQVNDYAFWDAALEATANSDVTWLDDNIGSTVEESEAFVGIAVVTADLERRHVWESPLEGETESDLFSTALLEDARAQIANAPAGPKGARSFFRAIDGHVVAYAVQRISPQTETPDVPVDGRSLILFADELNSEMLTELGSQFLIDDLSIAEVGSSSPVAAGQLVSPVSGADGAAIAALRWTAPTPARDLLLTAALPISLVLVGFMMTASWVARRAANLADQLDDERSAATLAAHTDSMSGLLNRAGFQHMFQSSVVEQAAKDGKLCALYLDVNNFKSINDSLGHKVGDALIVAIAERLRQALPESAIVGRVGGDEFVVLGIDAEFAEDCPQIAGRAANLLDASFDLAGHSIHSSCSVGYAKAAGSDTAADVVRKADVAMYHAKAARLTGARCYDVEMDAETTEFLALETILRHALDHDEFFVVYQPILNVRHGTIEHVEALLRLDAPGRGLIPPDVFIPVAERTGLIQEIGLRVLETVCRDLARWPAMTAAVNISPVQLLNIGFVPSALAIAKRHNVKPASIIFELTEGVLIDSPRLARSQLAALKDAGFSIFLDDFGAGFSSIGYLSQFPFDGVKIDKSLVQRSGQSAESTTVLDSIIAMARAMRLEVVAEGVETEEQRDLLKNAACDWLQGYFISRPVSVETVAGFVTDYNVAALRDGLNQLAAADLADHGGTQPVAASA